MHAWMKVRVSAGSEGKSVREVEKKYGELKGIFNWVINIY